MDWLTELPEKQPVAWAVLVLMLVAVVGLALARIKIKGIGIGVTGVLFAGIIAGHLGIHLDKEILDFVREFGLILFVFTIGLQLGPGFFASLRKQGLKLNFIAAFIVIFGAVVTVCVARFGSVKPIASLGLFSGATTNTPSLGAVQQMLKALGGTFGEQAGLSAVAYAVAYPGGIFGIIASLLLLRFLFKKGSSQELEQLKLDPLERKNIAVENPAMENVRLAEIARQAEVVVSRIKRHNAAEVETTNEQTTLHKKDILLAVGARSALEKFCSLVGRESNWDLRQATTRILSQRIIVTRKDVLGKTLDELGLSEICGVAVTRLARAEIEMTALHDLRLQFGDTLQVVGDEVAIKKAIEVLGNRVKALHETNFLPIFIGIALGIVIGMIPIAIPHVPVPVRIGMAGGPLILALILSRVGRIGPLIWYMPAPANIAFRELGIVLFLACVGIKAGDRFFATVFTNEGLHLLLGGLVITMLPLLIAGVIAHLFLKLNINVIGGVLAGSMTDPPALAFAHAISKSDAPLVAYATVYPLTMLMRIFTAQILVLIFCD